MSVDKEGGKVVHANHVPEPYRSAAFNAKTWAASISDVLGGKVSLILLMLMTYTFPFVFFFCDCMYANNIPLPQPLLLLPCLFRLVVKKRVHKVWVRTLTRPLKPWISLNSYSKKLSIHHDHPSFPPCSFSPTHHPSCLT